jgi:hypothetical protein
MASSSSLTGPSARTKPAPAPAEGGAPTEVQARVGFAAHLELLAAIASMMRQVSPALRHPALPEAAPRTSVLI